MSIKIMSAVWDSSLPTHTQKIVLLSLADQANDQGKCWPSIDSISRRCDLSRQGVMDQIEKLKSTGFLKVESGEGRRSNTYTVVVNAVDHKPDSVAVNGVDPSSQRRLPQQSTPDTVAVNGVDPIRKDPSLTPNRTVSGSASNTVSESEQIYRLYPRKTAKIAALKSIQKALKKEDFETLKSATQKFAAKWIGKDLQYCPYPAKWFNNEQYNDEDSAPPVCDKLISEMSESEYQAFMAYGQSKSCL